MQTEIYEINCVKRKNNNHFGNDFKIYDDDDNVYSVDEDDDDVDIDDKIIIIL